MSRFHEEVQSPSWGGPAPPKGLLQLKCMWQFVLWQPGLKYLHPPEEQPPRDSTLLLLLLILMIHELCADCNYQCWLNYSIQLPLFPFSYLQKLSSSSWALPSTTWLSWINLNKLTCHLFSSVSLQQFHAQESSNPSNVLELCFYKCYRIWVLSLFQILE